MDAKKNPMILKTLSQKENLARTADIIKRNHSSNAAKVTRIVCETFGFKDAKGNLQYASCYKALSSLDDRGLIDFPMRQPVAQTFNVRCLPQGVAEPENVPARVEDVTGLRLVLVEADEQRLILNTILMNEHPLGATRFAGYQLSYLVMSDNGCLGGLCFAASAYRVSVRDQWIGWSDDEREEQLNNIIGLSRFLIRKSVHCKNLASKILSMAAAQMPQDFKNKYGFAPLLIETFVQKNEEGTCYKAANWLEIGETKGKGRQGFLSGTDSDKKRMFIYVLNKDFRNILEIEEKVKEEIYKKKEITEGLSSDEWAEQEFGDCDLGDPRRTQRLVSIAEAIEGNPSANFAALYSGDRYGLKSALEFIENKNKKINVDSISSNHRKNTVCRILSQERVIHIAGNTYFYFKNVKKCEGLGFIEKKDKTIVRGIASSSILTITERGIPLGIPYIHLYAPEKLSSEEVEYRKKHQNQIPLEQRKIYKWIIEIRKIREIAEHTPDTVHVYVADREADKFDIFQELNCEGNKIHYVIRVSTPRGIEGSEKTSFDFIRSTNKLGTAEMVIPGDNEGREERISEFGIYAHNVKIKSPRNRRSNSSINTNIVRIIEETPSDGEDPIEWILYTSLPIDNMEDIISIVGIYRKRWRIEEWHRVIKIACNVEGLKLRTFERFCRTLTIKMIIAWRIMLLTLLGREHPELPAEVTFSGLEAKLLSSKS